MEKELKELQEQVTTLFKNNQNAALDAAIELCDGNFLTILDGLSHDPEIIKNYKKRRNEFLNSVKKEERDFDKCFE